MPINPTRTTNVWYSTATIKTLQQPLLPALSEAILKLLMPLAGNDNHMMCSYGGGRFGIAFDDCGTAAGSVSIALLEGCALWLA